MEDILFRGKRFANGEWIYGVPVQHSSGDYQIFSGYSNANSILVVDSKTICQYTGCLTADIKKIFVNDIVEVDGIIGVVKFGKYGNGFHLGYYIEWINCGYRQELGFWEGKVKHLGNVFDNSELIKG